jgi:hypothetical protein
VSVCTPIVDVLAARRFSYASEEDLQAGLAAALADTGFEVEREVRLDDRSRIDLVVGRVGVEVKVAGKPGSVLSQLRRYAASDRLDGLLLVTSAVRHRLPDTVGGKPLSVFQIVGAGL